MAAQPTHTLREQMAEQKYAIVVLTRTLQALADAAEDAEEYKMTDVLESVIGSLDDMAQAIHDALVEEAE